MIDAHESVPKQNQRSSIAEVIRVSLLEMRSLINACDCFVSLHRAEGFGRGTGEAMFLGRLAMATGWSGNLDYMTSENSLLVNHRLVPVGDGQYPFAKGQVWAEPDLDHAVTLIESMLDDRARARMIAARGRSDIRLGHNFRAVGIRILDRLTEISAALRIRPKAPISVSKTRVAQPKREAFATSSARRQTSSVIA